MNIIVIVFGVYFTLCFLTAWLLAHTPFSENGFIINLIFAPAYWWAALRGGI